MKPNPEEMLEQALIDLANARLNLGQINAEHGAAVRECQRLSAAARAALAKAKGGAS